MHSLIAFLSAIGRSISAIDSTLEDESVDVTSFPGIGIDDTCNLGSNSKLFLLE